MSVDPQNLFPGKHFISTILDALETKTEMSWHLRARYLQRAAMAGIIIAVLYATNFALVASFATLPAGDGTLLVVGRVLGALAFGWALVFIYYSKSELLTSNMMIVCIGAYYHRTSLRRAGTLLTLCYLGNLAGGLLLAWMFSLSTVTGGEVAVQMSAAVAHKLDYLGSTPGITDLLVRAILCNFMINLAMLLVYNGLIRDDLTRSLVMITSVFIFAFLGLEHSVANSVLFCIVGLRDGIDVTLAAANVGVALVGNFIGGGLLIGIYYAFVNDDVRYLRRHPPDRLG